MDVVPSSPDHAVSPGGGSADWAALLGALGAALVAFDRGLTVVACAGAADPGLVGRPLRDVLPGPVAAYDAALRAILAGEPSTTVEVIASEPSARSHQTELAATRGPADEVTGGIAVIRDVTASRQRSTQLFETAFANAPIGLALVSLDGRWLKVNGALCQWLGYSEAELLTRSFQEITHPDDLDADMRQVQRLIDGEIERYAMPKRYVTRDGDEVWANLSVSLVRDEDGQPVHFISQIEDISERKRLEIALQHLADHDHLTELWNRRAFEQHLRRQVAQCRRGSGPAALLIVDLDGFKRVNDTHGHAAGDALLVSVANTLRARLRASDCIARIGGDEFAVILSQTRPDAVEGVVESLADQIRDACVEVGGRDVGVTASIGVAILDRDGPDEGEALDAADRAMYARKGTRSPERAPE